VRIPKERFDTWAAEVHPEAEDLTPSRVAKLAGISKSSFFFQRGKGYVEGTTVIALSRALNLSPLDELVKFDGLEIFRPFEQPSLEEVLSQLRPESLMVELLGRLQNQAADHQLPDMPDMPETFGLKQWLDTTDLHGQYGQLAKVMGLASKQVLSKKINENRLTLEQLVTLCDFGHLNARLGLVITGMMDWEEVGLSSNTREKVLSEAPGQLVIDALMRSRRWLERDIQVKELESGVHRNLG